MNRSVGWETKFGGLPIVGRVFFFKYKLKDKRKGRDNTSQMGRLSYEAGTESSAKSGLTFFHVQESRVV